MKKKLLNCLLCSVVVLLGTTGCSNDNQQPEDGAKDPVQQENLGNVVQETVNTIVAKYNTEIMDSGLNTPAYDDYMLVENGLYWFGLTEEVSFYVKPLQCTEDKIKDIAEISGILIKKENFNEDTALKYFKNLIRANNYDLSDEEIESLIKEAKELQKDNFMANNGKGLYIAIMENNDNVEYQVKRIYK